METGSGVQLQIGKPHTIERSRPRLSSGFLNSEFLLLSPSSCLRILNSIPGFSMCPDPPDINRDQSLSPPPRVSPVPHRRAVPARSSPTPAATLPNGDTNQAAAISLYAILSFIPCSSSPCWRRAKLGGQLDVQRELLDGFRQVTPCLTESILQQLGAVEQKAQILGWVFFTSCGGSP